MEIGRKRFDHVVPSGASGNVELEVFFVTICCKERGVNSLARPEAWERMVEAMAHFEDLGELRVPLALAMPDHFHALWVFSGGRSMQQVVTGFKRWVARQAGVAWQRDFFDHRIRGWESAEEKRTYILQNPVRAGLAATSEEWPYQVGTDLRIGPKLRQGLDMQ
jgi:REP element-mobilizing transposase RayT